MEKNISDKSIASVEKAIGYTFKNKSLLSTALKHSSYDKNENYEKLEFLGDSVLSVVISDFLFKTHNYLQEGEMTVTRAYAVCEESLSKVCKRLGIDRHILVGFSAVGSKVNANKSVIADAFESVIGAIYLDSGFSYVKPFIISNLNEFIVEYIKSGDNNDHKTKLQHLVQSQYQEEPKYLVKEEKGPPHDKTFVVEALVMGMPYGKGKGKTKKEAQQAAAKDALNNIEKKGLDNHDS
ncbi:MAG: ribonuclease III [Clostridia bacterium]|jgi:ribonuclease-3|nr:ribonuclease III [Clostridia bacterium]NLV33012.1 ribonuclease III [Clostridiaceae bacterium]MDD4502857.1 ribonuclease III [Clostridia bacterium]HPB17355.1 ribonuclease III [Clostridia bacterium]HQM95901.1 ribonuclease III [Clostridia bacterium]